MADYQKTNWQNKPSTSTPINKANLNHMEQGIYDAQHTADQAAAGVAELQGLNFAPIPVSTVAEMTDETKIYVYLGSETGYQANHWYYWNGSAWTEGGVYNSTALVTDPDLENAGMAADAKATGDAVSNLKSALNSLIVGELYVNPNDYENGNVTVSTGYISYVRKSRVFNKNVMSVQAGTRFTISDDYKFLFCFYDDEYSHTDDWVTDYTFEENRDNVRIVITERIEDPESELAVSDALETLNMSWGLISDIKKKTDEMYVQLGDNIPSYYDDKLSTVIDLVRDNNILSGKKGASFIFSTDQHFNNTDESYNLNNAGYTVLLAKKISEKTNNHLLVLGGDVLTKDHTKNEGISILRNFYLQAYNFFGENYRALKGNHDLNVLTDPTETEKLLTDNELFSIAFKGFENAVISNGEMYYYWDDTNAKIRFIALDFGTNATYSDDQLTWLYNTIMNAGEGYAIIVFTHGIVSNYTDPNTYTLVGNNQQMLNMLYMNNERGSYKPYDTRYDFANSKSTVKIVIAGHIHKDGNIDWHNIPVVFTKNDSYALSSNHKSTYQETAFDCVDIDLVNDKAYFVRLGYNNGNEREFNLPATVG